MVEPHAAFPLARLTTVRTGGAAEHFARAGSRRELRELLGWARERRLAGACNRLGLEPAGGG